MEFDNLPSGDYTLTITDSNCPYDIVRNYTLTEPLLLLGAATLISDPIDCNGGTETYSITASGGVPPYTGTGNYTLAAGVHTIVVADSNGCTSTQVITVTEPTELQIQASVTSPILCFGGTAQVTVTATGGTPAYTGTGIFTVTAGNYIYFVYDANGCSKSISISISEIRASSL